jgi:hypothetical protein
LTEKAVFGKLMVPRPEMGWLGVKVLQRGKDLCRIFEEPLDKKSGFLIS